MPALRDVLVDALDMVRDAAESLARELEAERANRRAAEAERDRAFADRDSARRELAVYHQHAGIAPRWSTQEGDPR